MYQGGIETSIKEAVGFELLPRGIEIAIERYWDCYQGTCWKCVENALFL